MKTLSLVVFALMLSAPAFAKKDAPAPKENKAVAQLKMMGEKMLMSWDKGDMETFKATISDTSIMKSYDLDMTGRPVGFETKGDVLKMFEQVAAGMKSMGGTMSSKITMNDCKVYGEIGICTMEADGTMTMPKMPPMAMSLRSTDVYHREKSGWKAIHHHGSLNKAPEMPMKSIVAGMKDAQWQQIPQMKNLMMAPIWMNPVTQATAMLVKVTEDEKEARHMHPFGMTFTVLEGNFTTTGPDGKDVELSPGMVFYRAAGEPHTTTMKKGSVMFAVTDGPMQTVPVDAAGKPMASNQ